MVFAVRQLASLICQDVKLDVGDNGCVVHVG